MQKRGTDMRAVFGLVLVLGMGLAGFAVYMVKGYVNDQQTALQRERAKAAATIATVDVYAATRPLAYGEPLTPEDVTLIKYAKDFLPEGAFTSEEELFPEGGDVARVVLRPMEVNEPVLAVKVSAPGEDAGITSRLAPGMSAFTINVDVSSGVSGFLRPGDRVDVYWTGTVGSGQGVQPREITRLIESGVELIAVDQNTDANRPGPAVARTVTVQVSPQDVADLTQAQASGSLTLALVGKYTNTEELASVIEVDQRTLLGIAEEIVVAPAPVAAPPPTCTISTRRGTDVVEIPIPCTQ